MTDSITTRESMKALSDLSAYIAKSGIIGKACIIGIKGLKAANLNSVNLLTKINLQQFDTIEQAKKWLVSQQK